MHCPQWPKIGLKTSSWSSSAGVKAGKRQRNYLGTCGCSNLGSLLKDGPQCKKKVTSEPPKGGLYLFFNYRPLKPLLSYPTRATLDYFYNEGPPLSTLSLTMTRSVYTSRVSFPQWHGLMQAHFPPRSRKTAWLECYHAIVRMEVWTVKTSGEQTQQPWQLSHNLRGRQLQSAVVQPGSFCSSK